VETYSKEEDSFSEPTAVATQSAAESQQNLQAPSPAPKLTVERYTPPPRLRSVPEVEGVADRADSQTASYSLMPSPRAAQAPHPEPTPKLSGLSLPPAATLPLQQPCRQAVSGQNCTHLSASEPDRRVGKVCDSGLDIQKSTILKPGFEGPPLPLQSLTSSKNFSSCGTATCAAPSPLLVIRLPRVRDLTLQQHPLMPHYGSKSPASRQSSLHKGVALPEHLAPLCQEMHSQRALGQGLHVDAKALLLWYAPYLVLASLLIGAALIPVLCGAAVEIFPVSIVIMLLFPPLHLARMVRYKRSLCVAVDYSSLAEVHLQLQAPLLRLTLAGQGMCTASLNNALHCLQQPPLLALDLGSVLRSPSARHCGICTLVWLMAQGIMWLAVDNVWADVLIMVVGTLVLVLWGCSPWTHHPQQDLVDERFGALESAFNTMLDTLRPLLGDMQDAAPLQPSTTRQNTAPNSGLSMAALQRHSAEVADASWLAQAVLQDDDSSASLDSKVWSVRLLTSERLTLRAELRLTPVPMARPEKGTVVGGHLPQQYSLQITCHLAGVELRTNKVLSSSTTTLGRSVAAAADHCQPVSPTHSRGAVPSLWNQYFDSSAQAQLQQAARRRQDDEVSCSLASISTASTLRTRGGQVDEAALQRGLSMVRSLAAKRNCPLELFSGPARRPPKAAADDFALLLGVQQEDPLSAAKGFVEMPLRLKLWTKATRMLRSGNAVLEPLQGDKDTNGLLHSSVDLNRLCRSGAHVSGSGPMESIGNRARNHADSPRSDASSVCSDVEVDLQPNSYLQHMQGARHDSPTIKHVVVLFDTVKERALCQKMLREAKLTIA